MFRHFIRNSPNLEIAQAYTTRMGNKRRYICTTEYYPAVKKNWFKQQQWCLSQIWAKQASHKRSTYWVFSAALWAHKAGQWLPRAEDGRWGVGGNSGGGGWRWRVTQMSPSSVLPRAAQGLWCPSSLDGLLAMDVFIVWKPELIGVTFKKLWRKNVVRNITTSYWGNRL